MEKLRLTWRGQHLLLMRGSYCLGRTPEADIKLFDDRVSRRHAILHVADDAVSIEDLRSRNGVYVNGKRVKGAAVLRAGDKITIGGEVLDLSPEPLAPSRRVSSATLGDSERGETTTEGSTSAFARPSLDALSPREREVLELLAAGYAQREVGEMLGVSIKTVDTYRARLYDKLHLEGRADLVRYAVNLGLLRPE